MARRAGSSPSSPLQPPAWRAHGNSTAGTGQSSTDRRDRPNGFSEQPAPATAERAVRLHRRCRRTAAAGGTAADVARCRRRRRRDDAVNCLVA